MIARTKFFAVAPWALLFLSSQFSITVSSAEDVGTQRFGPPSHYREPSRRGYTPPHGPHPPHGAPHGGPHGGPDRPSRKQGYHPACCLARWPTNGYGDPKPLLNQLLFKDCPDKKTPDAICEAATRKLVTPPSILQTSVHKTVKAQDLEFNYGKAKSPFASDIGIVANGCCFNLYPDVKSYQPISSDCDNPLIGDTQDLIDSVFSTSVMVAGDADIIGTYEKSVVIGGDFLQDVASPATVIAANSFGGPYPQAGFVLGGSVAPAGGDINVNTGDFLLGGDDAGRVKILGGGSEEELTNVALAIDKISAQICAISTNIAALKATANAVFSPVTTTRRLSETAEEVVDPARQLRSSPSCSQGDDCAIDMESIEDDPNTSVRRLQGVSQAVSISFSCDQPICVYDLTTADLTYATDILFPGSSSSRTLKINVLGTAVNTVGITAASTVDDPMSTVIWNFPTANSLTLDLSAISAKWPGSVLCPKCATMEVLGAGATGMIGLGNRSSVLSISNANAVVTGTNGVPACPPPDPEVIYCHCLCPETYKPVEYPPQRHPY